MKGRAAENLREWLENPHWRMYYEGAPSEKCRERIALEFLLSEDETEETAAELDRTEAELSLEDWQYLYRFSGNNPERKKIHERIIAMGGS